MKNKLNLKVLMFLILFLGTSFNVCPAQDSPRETPVVKVVRENAQAVVNISTEQIIFLRENPYWGSYGSEFDYFFDSFFGFNQPRTQAYKLNSVGSGVIVDKEGLVVTNAHVVHMASNVYVILNDGTSIKGDVVYEDSQDDLAIIKIESTEPLEAAKLGEANDIMIGETVVAIGNPLGLENSVTVGIISGKDRDFMSSRGELISGGLLQTDAPINPGNSGGGLINLDGELIGINVAVVQNSQSIGFAIPVNKVKEALASHERNKSFTVENRYQNLPRNFQSQSPSPVITEDEYQDFFQDPWYPFSEMDSLLYEMDQMFDGALSQGQAPNDKGVFSTDIFYDTSFKLEEDKDKYIYRLNIQGMNKDKMNIQVRQHALSISGETTNETQEQGAQGYYSSQSFASFMKTIPIPEDADTRAMTTKIQGDQLIIVMPKK